MAVYLTKLDICKEEAGINIETAIACGLVCLKNWNLNALRFSCNIQKENRQCNSLCQRIANSFSVHWYNKYYRKARWLNDPDLNKIISRFLKLFYGWIFGNYFLPWMSWQTSLAQISKESYAWHSLIWLADHSVCCADPSSHGDTTKGSCL